MDDTYIRLPVEVFDKQVRMPFFSVGYGYAIAATDLKTARRYIIKVSDRATREQLLVEIKRMNARKGRFFYTLTNEGGTV